MKLKVFIALSGGVDSSVAAALLKERGFDVSGVHIKMWSDPSIPCTLKEDRHDATRVAAKLDIPFETWDFTKEYKEAVVNYMIHEYAAGRTPNPDVMCNSRIKFGAFLRRALEMGADYIATGHYVRLMRKSQIINPKSKTNSKFTLLQARDENKDQSYFLWTLTQNQLRYSLFPIGDHTKPEVRELARVFKLPTAEKKDSQGLCFIGKIDIRKFLKDYIPEKQGRVLTATGRVVGEHSGVAFHTIGQRSGLGIGGGLPLYIAEKDFGTNTLIVAEGENDPRLYKNELIAGDTHWISGESPKFPLQCEARIRYRQPLQAARIMNNESGIRVQFEEPQRAVASGQSVVFYQGEELIGGGIIV